MCIRFCLAVGAVVCLAVFTGCSNQDKWEKKRPKVVKASGEVLLMGKPLAHATVVFNNVDAGCSATAITTDSGRFVLTTFKDGDGAVPGAQQVTVSKCHTDYPGTKLAGLAPDEQQQALAKMPENEQMPIRAKEVIVRGVPQRYSEEKSSGLTAEVVEKGENHFRFDLTGK